MTEEQKWKERFLREREAKKEAEKLLEDKSREIYLINEELKDLNENLEEKVQEKTAELEKLNRSLEKKVLENIQKIRSQDELLIKQSRSAAMGEMIEMIAHQWRQPITGIGMTIDNMLFDIDLKTASTKKFKKNFELISTQVQYLSKTIEDFRGFFKQNKQKEKILLKDAVHESLNIVKKSLDNKQIKCSLDLQDSEPIEVYKNELTQVILNLVKNSMEVLEERKVPNPRILIKTAQKENTYKLFVVDNAGGIPDEVLPKVFDPYFSTKKAKNGTGIGLYMCKSIIEGHMKGAILAKNGEHGAVFTVVLKRRD